MPGDSRSSTEVFRHRHTYEEVSTTVLNDRHRRARPQTFKRLVELCVKIKELLQTQSSSKLSSRDNQYSVDQLVRMERNLRELHKDISDLIKEGAILLPGTSPEQERRASQSQPTLFGCLFRLVAAFANPSRSRSNLDRQDACIRDLYSILLREIQRLVSEMQDLHEAQEKRGRQQRASRQQNLQAGQQHSGGSRRHDPRSSGRAPTANSKRYSREFADQNKCREIEKWIPRPPAKAISSTSRQPARGREHRSREADHVRPEPRGVTSRRRSKTDTVRPEDSISRAGRRSTR